MRGLQKATDTESRTAAQTEHPSLNSPGHADSAPPVARSSRLVRPPLPTGKAVPSFVYHFPVWTYCSKVRVWAELIIPNY